MTLALLITAVTSAWAQSPTIYFQQDYSSETVDWSTGTGGRYTPIIEDGYLTVTQDQRNNNGTTLTCTATQGKVDAGKDFTMTLNVKLGASDNQAATAFNIYDGSNSGLMLSLAEGSVGATAWIINGGTQTATVSAGGGKSLNELSWIFIQVTSIAGGKTYLTLKDEQNNIIDGFDKTEIPTISEAGGLGKMRFVTSRRLANFAIDNVLVRDVVNDDLPQEEIASDVDVTTNAANEQDLFTEASFTMPAFDATAEYELVRDMSIQMTATMGDGTDGVRYRVKKDGNKFIPAEMEMAAVPALFTVNDAIEQKALTQTQDYIVQIYAIDAEGQPSGEAMTFATFTFEPGIYAVKAVAADGSDYDGETALSNQFELCVKSDLTLTAGSDFTIDGSKATLTVDGTDKSAAIAEGKLADVDMNANVSIAANDGYVMTALSVTCGEQNVSVTTADGVSSFTMPEAPATVAYTLTRDMSVKVTTQIAERVRIQKKEGKFDAVDPFELIPILTDKIGSTDKNMSLGEETGTSGDFYIKGFQKLDGEDWVDVTELGVGTYRLVIAGKGNYDGTIYTAAIELYQGYEVTIPAGEFITYYKDENLYTEDEDAELYTIASVTDTEAVLSSQINVVAAGTPMLIFNKGTEANTFLLIPTTEQADDVDYDSDHFKGTLEAKTFSADDMKAADYYVCNGHDFVWVKDAGTLAAGKCWLQISKAATSGARRLTITFDEPLTGIESVITDTEDANWYDLNGRRLDKKPAQKGLFIKNGKKVVVK
jgi:hypothetical protein